MVDDHEAERAEFSQELNDGEFGEPGYLTKFVALFSRWQNQMLAVSACFISGLIAYVVYDVYYGLTGNNPSSPLGVSSAWIRIYLISHGQTRITSTFIAILSCSFIFKAVCEYEVTRLWLRSARVVAYAATAAATAGAFLSVLHLASSQSSDVYVVADFTLATRIFGAVFGGICLAGYVLAICILYWCLRHITSELDSYDIGYFADDG